jgi:hypothetical protein
LGGPALQTAWSIGYQRPGRFKNGCLYVVNRDKGQFFASRYIRENKTYA